MPGLDLSQVSGNWKKLQETLQAPQSGTSQSNGLKRKRPLEKRDLNGYKKARADDGRLRRSGKAHRMGFGSSKPDAPTAVGDAHSKLVNEHGISKNDVSTAYGTSQGPVRRHIDDVNGGLHPTNEAGKYVALDCEMVGTGPPPHLEHVLARVSVVNYHGEQIYDSYVRPPDGIVIGDYRTFVSGIKASHLVAGYARPLFEVQKDIADLMQDRILVGHALRNDLTTLMLSHPKRDLRDTSRHAKFRIESRGKPPALRNLAKSELGMEIQTGEHSSLEDARAAMLLFRKEKAGFEEENRKQFGQRTRIAAKGSTSAAGRNGRTTSELDEESGDESFEDDTKLPESEEDDIPNGFTTSAAKPAAPAAQKKRKKKKRTKRK